GDHFSANPVSLKTGVLTEDLKTVDLVVVPGYQAETAAGEPVLLGRGGSDLSAVFIGKSLKDAGHDVRVRLTKDVDAVYDTDPAAYPYTAKPYASRNWDEAEKIAFPIVQAKAMRYAHENDLTVEVAALAKGYETVLGTETKLRTKPVAKRKIRVAVMGAGGVGAMFLQRAQE